MEKAPKTTTVTIGTISEDSLTVPVSNAAGTKLEYTVIRQGSADLAGAVWSDVIFKDGEFTIDRELAAGSYTVCIREKEDDNYMPSSPAKLDFILSSYSVTYDANGGKGKVPGTVLATTGTDVDVATEPVPTRTGYSFIGWGTTPNDTNYVTTVNSAQTLYAIWTPNTYTVNLDVKDGDALTGWTAEKTYDTPFSLPAPTKTGYLFKGWTLNEAMSSDTSAIPTYAGGQTVKNLADGTQDNSGVTLYAVWFTQKNNIKSKVQSGESADVTLKLMRGDSQYGETLTIALSPVNEAYIGSFIFRDVPYGIYNLVIEQVLDNGEILTNTILVNVGVTVKDENGNVISEEGSLPMSGSTRSVLKVKGNDTPAAIVGNLDKEAESQKVDERDVTVTMTIEKKEEKAVTGYAITEEKEAQSAIGFILDAITDDEEKENIEFFDVTITKEVSLNGEIESSEKLTQTEQIIEIILPLDLPSGKTLSLYSYHNGQKVDFTNSESKAPRTFYYKDGLLHIFTKEFSIYAVSFKEKTSGGGGGGGTTTYTPVTTQPEHGTITVNPASPKADQNAVVTVTPEDGYETEDVIVKDKDGNTVPVTKNDDGTFTFTQPSTGPVTIEAVVKQATDLTPVIKNPEHGTISVNPAKPKAGEPAIVTVTPDEGYEIDSVIITDKEGKPVAFTLNEDGTYSFVQPASGCVTIEAVLRLKDGVIVRFDLNGKTGTEPDPQTFAKGGKAVRPNDPAAEGYKFTGWYTEKECKNVYDFDTPVNEDLILYAGWEKTGPGPDDKDFGIYFTELFDDPYDGVHYNAKEDRYEIVYTGTNIKPLIRVTSKADGVLKEGIDYSVSYSNNKNVSKPNKPATIRVNGKGFYKSKKVLELYILRADLEEANSKGLLAGADEFKVLNGNKLNPMIVYRGYKLAGRDRDIINKNKITGDTTTDVTGRGNFTGTLKDVPVKVISKDDQKNGAIKVNLKAAQHVYNGKAHKLSVTTEKETGELTVTAGSSKTPLIEDTDFVVSYSGNILAGKATVTITGIGKCNGTVVKNFTIQPDKTIDITAELANTAEPVYFNVRGAQPDIKVTAHRKAEDEKVTDEVLVEGRDYKVSYSSNKKVGKGSYTVKFVGNYNGHKAVKGTFDIVQASISTAKVEAMQMIYKNPGKYLSKPFVSIDGVQLKTSDYTYKYYIGEEEITSKYKLSLADGVTSKTVKIVVTGKGNYSDTTAEGTYEVVRRGTESIDLTKAKIVAKDKVKGKDVSVAKQEYNGYAIEPEIRVMARVNRKWVDVDPEFYSVSHINNVNKGTATILVSGNGNETIGSKTARFSINTMLFERFKLIFGTAIHYI